MKSELKIEYSHPKQLDKVIKKSYFEDDSKGRLMGKKAYLEIEESDEIYLTLKGLNNMTIRINQPELVDGTCRFLVDESDGMKLYPISMFCLVDDNNKYTFY